MPNRILREGILTSARIAKLGWAEEVFYRRLMSVVDDFGRYFADLGLLRAACYPRQLNKVSDSDVGKWLHSCADAGLVRVYPAQDGESYLELLDFKQQVRAKASKYPSPDTGMRSECVADDAHTQSNEHLDVSVSVSVCGGDTGAAQGSARVVPIKPDQQPNEASDLATLGEANFARLVAEQHAKAFSLPRAVPVGLQLGSLVTLRAQSYAPAQSGDWWLNYFEHCAADDFLNGTKNPKFKADLVYLLDEKTFGRVIESSQKEAANG